MIVLVLYLNLNYFDITLLDVSDEKDLTGYIVFYILYYIILFVLFLIFGGLEENPVEMTCNATSDCKVHPFDALFAILDCAGESLLDAKKQYF